MVNLEWYRTFIAIYREKTASGAARALYLTQPAVSQHLASLETALGTRLFERTPRRMVPTEAGQRLYNQVVGAVEQLTGVAAQSFEGNSPIRLGTPTEFFAERVLPRLALAAPDRLKVSFGLAQPLLAQLADDRLEAVIATQKMALGDLDYEPLYQEMFWLVGPPGMSPPSDWPDWPDWLAQQSWIAYSEDLPIIRRFCRLALGHRLALSARLVLPDLRQIRHAIAANLGISVLPNYLCKSWLAEQRLTLLLAPEKPVVNQLWLAYRKPMKRSKAVMRLKEWLTDD
ncbi:MAG: LysR family transcriptional regulator [Cyanobacteria bacterium P01_A01_bin.114]